MSSFATIVPFKSPALWKGVGLGVVMCIAALAIGIPNLMMTKRAARLTGLTQENASYLGPTMHMSLVEADGPKIVRKAQLDLLVSNCAETQKKIEKLSGEESGFVESSTVEENSARLTIRVPTQRLDAVRTKLRELALRVRQDSVTAADVSKQYFDGEARLRNLRAEEQQFLEVMKKAHTVPDILAVTKSLSEVREEIEQADAEFRHLRDHVEMAQIEISLNSQINSEVRWSAGSSIKSAWSDLLQSLASIGDFLIWVIINIPVIVLWIVIIFLLACVAWFVLRTGLRLLKRVFGKKSELAQSPAKL